MSICYYFHPDGYTTAGRQVMGRHVAGESFLKAALKYGSNSELWIQIEKNKHISIFESIAKSCGRHQEVHSINRETLGQLSEPGCVFLPGPGVGEWARHRSRFGDASWSICGITHTTASTRAMDSISKPFCPLRWPVGFAPWKCRGWPGFVGRSKPHPQI